MDYTLEEKAISKSKSRDMLEKFKKKEKNIKFHTKRINSKTIVFCKNKERISEFENSCNSIKSV